VTRGALVLRPEPGNTATRQRLAAHGVFVSRCPLFAVTPLAWNPPDARSYDSLLLTSANAVRHGGPGLRAFGLPVLAVGQATAEAARISGLTVELTGDTDAVALLAEAYARGWRRPLHLAGRDRIALPGVDAIAVYASDALPVDAATVLGWRGLVALVHSARAARHFAALATPVRSAVAIAAISPAVADAAGGGWAIAMVASASSDAALVALARDLIDQPRWRADKADA
jgi:uroporphyrinogen-III synthase